MIDWFDMMRRAQGGQAFDNLARQFGLTADQARTAALAVLPAFAMGLQRNVTQSSATPDLFRAMLGPFATFWESAAQAYTPQARQQGQQLLDRLFDNDEVSRRVAQQAAAFSGVGVDVMQQMLPLIAGILAGGLARMASQQGAMMAALASPGQAAGQGASPRPSSPGLTGVGAWAEYWSRWLSGGAAPAETRSTETADEMAEAVRKPQRTEAPKDASDDPFGFSQVFATGREMQRQHLENLQSIFDRFWGDRDKAQ
jgi:hypothetical protein